MKKSILVLILAFSALVANAQSKVEGSLPSWWKGTPISNADKNKQVDTIRSEVKIVDTPRNTDFLNLVVHAVAPSLRIVKQQYRLKKDGDYFGKNNMNHFGESFSLAVKVADGMILQHSVMYPWLNDKDYLEINSAGTYSPVLYKSFQKPVTGGDYEGVNLELDSPYVRNVGRDSLLYMHYDIYRDFGMYMDTKEGEKKGYLLWVSWDKDTVSFSVESYSVDAVKGKTIVPLDPSSPSSLLGGIFVVPVFEKPGTVTFYLAGVASTVNHLDWSLKLLTKDDANISIIN